jgi:hypothetical protein
MGANAATAAVALRLVAEKFALDERARAGSEADAGDTTLVVRIASRTSAALRPLPNARGQSWPKRRSSTNILSAAIAEQPQ